MSPPLPHATAEAVARRSYGKLVALLVARTRDVSAAEDALAEAFAAALADWPRHGCPANPEAWLLTTARRRALNRARQTRADENARDQLERLLEPPDTSPLPDHRLALLFACAHPALDEGIRAPLMLQVVVGLDAATIASAFLLSPAAMGQRLVRAKQKIATAGIAFRVPEPDELAERLPPVLDALYAAFTEGWADPLGSNPARRDLADEALFLARLVVELLPREPEALGALALMLHAQARRNARRSETGAYVPFDEQDPSAWDADLIAEAEALLLRASRLGAVGRYQLEGALHSAHVHRRRTGERNWAEVVVLYDRLWELSHSPVVAVNRALARGEALGPSAGLEAITELEGTVRLADYQPYWAARAELLAKAGQVTLAADAYLRAIGLERDPAVREFLQARRDRLHPPSAT